MKEGDDQAVDRVLGFYADELPVVTALTRQCQVSQSVAATPSDRYDVTLVQNTV
jgi:hypothetical protein